MSLTKRDVLKRMKPQAKKETAKRMNAKPVIRKVDVQAIIAEFEAKKK